MKLTVIIPIHNEAPILEENLKKLTTYLDRVRNLTDYELLLVCNGCVDGSEALCKAFSEGSEKVRTLVVPSRGLGSAIGEGIKAATFDAMIFYAIDLPFGLEVIKESVDTAISHSGAVVIGSKGHKDSVIERTLARSLFSFTISTLNNLLFGLGVKDTQGSILFYKGVYDRYRKVMDSPGAFFQAQILIYSRVMGLELIEIPVTLKKDMRSTRFSLIGDGLKYIGSILRERIKLFSVR